MKVPKKKPAWPTDFAEYLKKREHSAGAPKAASLVSDLIEDHWTDFVQWAERRAAKKVPSDSKKSVCRDAKKPLVKALEKYKEYARYIVEERLDRIRTAQLLEQYHQELVPAWNAVSATIKAYEQQLSATAAEAPPEGSDDNGIDGDAAADPKGDMPPLEAEPTPVPPQPATQNGPTPAPGPLPDAAATKP